MAVETSSVPADERALIVQAVAGDGDAFLALVAQSDDQLRAVVFRMVGSNAAMDDVLQEAYIKAFRKIKTFDQRSSFRTWLFRIGFNAAIDYSRRNKRDTSQSMVETAVVDAAISGVEVRHDVVRALTKLSAEHIAAVMLVDAYGFSYGDAALVLGVPVGTVSSRLVHARTHLRTTLADYSEEQR